MRDRLFENELGEKFSFSKEVASVFDDMLPRSVPYYNDNIALITELLAGRRAICDLGCSTGNLLLFLAQNLNCEILCGIDNSAPMLEIAKAKANAYGVKITFIKADILDFDFKVPNYALDSTKNQNTNSNIVSETKQITSKAKQKMGLCSCKKGNKINPLLTKQMADLSQKDEFDSTYFDTIIANYTMQFIRPQKREKLCKKIYENLQKNGIFIMSEKLVSEDKWLDKRLIDIYHNFKTQNGYSKTEISKKREALENILIPFSQNENIAMLEDAGFKTVEVVFRFGNFATFIALKGN